MFNSWVYLFPLNFPYQELEKNILNHYVTTRNFVVSISIVAQKQNVFRFYVVNMTFFMK